MSKKTLGAEFRTALKNAIEAAEALQLLQVSLPLLQWASALESKLRGELLCFEQMQMQPAQEHLRIVRRYRVDLSTDRLEPDVPLQREIRKSGSQLLDELDCLQTAAETFSSAFIEVYQTVFETFGGSCCTQQEADDLVVLTARLLDLKRCSEDLVLGLSRFEGRADGLMSAAKQGNWEEMDRLLRF